VILLAEEGLEVPEAVSGLVGNRGDGQLEILA
jgi:hypothetical protein